MTTWKDIMDALEKLAQEVKGLKASMDQLQADVMTPQPVPRPRRQAKILAFRRPV